MCKNNEILNEEELKDIEAELANKIPEVDNWGNVATDIIKLKMNPKYSNLEFDFSNAVEEN